VSVLDRLYWVTDYIAGGPIPETVTDYLDLVEKCQVRCIVSLAEEWEYDAYTTLSLNDVQRLLSRLNVEFIHVPVKGGFAPDVNVLLTVCRMLKTNEELKVRTYVHCVGGMGRSPTLLTAYLIYSRKMKLEDALKYVFERNPYMSITDEQYYRLKEFELLILQEGVT